ncbi:MAG: hypothetical protein IIA72_17010, partial [Proteobacteria bacterium]|nr:hypothetical protein [Pseudomonadota bacterium]
MLGDDSGAKAVEYSLIMGLVGVMIIAGLIALGVQIGGTFFQVATIMGGAVESGSGSPGTGGTGDTSNTDNTGNTDTTDNTNSNTTTDNTNTNTN